ncbi:unnamed protein product [Caenorhabditis angaria]|uniref:TIR domain-containing protein n=1 Tax=Caenorhabditis angaria TaxID=860376 RepID=A0A9P1I764_9PELO|nr:unnamed protein product [Caenorhabditis angaria]
MRNNLSPLLILFLFLIFQRGISRAEENCPESCKCQPDANQPTHLQVTCNLLVSSSPKIHRISQQIRSLILTCADDTKIRLAADFLDGCTSLNNLRIEACLLPEKLFDNDSAANLRSLEIKNGRHLELTENLLQPLTRLEKLHVVESKNVPEITEKLLCALPNLQVLNLSTNTMPTLSRAESCIAQQLLIVDLSRNELRDVRNFLGGAPNIRQLSISQNFLQKIDDLSTLTPLLQQIDAESNEIADFSASSALPPTLVHINLAQNRLLQIPEVILSLPDLVALNLSGNAVSGENATRFASNDIEMFDISKNRLKNLPEEWLAGSQKSLVNLKLDANLIEKFEPGISFENFTNLQILDLSSNLLETLPASLFSSKNQKLSQILLANNSLTQIEPESLSGLKLDLLDLSENRLEDIPVELAQVDALKRVDLRRNRINKLAQNVLNRVKLLHYVDLSENLLQSIGPLVFTNSPDLHTLDLSKNEISLLFKDAFAKCPKLRKIVLKNNRIQSIDEGLLEANSLKKLDLSENRLVVLKWSALPDNLEHLQADKNSINLLTAAGRMSLKSISLTDNQISLLSGEQIPNSVENLDFSRNRINHLTKSTFSQKLQLRKVNLAENLIEILDGEAIKINGNVHPIRMNLLGNPLHCSCQMMWILENEELRGKNPAKVLLENRANTTCRHVIHKSQISLTSIQKDDLLCEYQQICEPDCICCQYENCDCKSVCPNQCECFRDNEFRQNIVRCEKKKSGNSSSSSSAANSSGSREFVVSILPVFATDITLTNLDLPQLRRNSFFGRTRLQTLRINGTGLRSIQAKAFKSLPGLKTLDLSNNLLLELNGDEFEHLNEVQQVFLNGNRLRQLSRKVVERFPKLRFLTLHNNSFEDIPAALSGTVSGTLSGISLSGNPLRCDCSAANGAGHHQQINRYGPPIIEHNAAEWMSMSRHLVVDAAKVECVENVTKAFMTNDTTILSGYPPNFNHDIFVMPIDEFLREYNVSICVPYSSGFFGQDPQNSIIFIALAVALSILMCLAVILAISFIRKSHDAINQRRYKATSSLNCSTSAGSSPLPIPLLSYHAFVSYSKKDEKMVFDQLCRPLEDDDYQLCLLHRDGPSWNSNLHAISDELIAQMESAQCLILVLTRNFLENEWKTLQIKTSHQLFSKNRQKRVIAVLADDVDANLLDEELGQILRKHTRIDMKSHLFWTLLHSSLPNRLPLNHHHHSSKNSDDSGSQVYSDIYGIVPSDVV